MAVYAVGDVQGCATSLQKLLDKIRFEPRADTLWLCGDLINRGAESLRVLRLIKELGASAVPVLGNHDLHALAIYAGVKQAKAGDTLDDILRAPDCDELMHWLRRRPLVHFDSALQTLMVHAGVYPGWRRKQLAALAGEAEAALRGDAYRDYLAQIYGGSRGAWRDDLEGAERMRFITNVLTRMRYCNQERELDFEHTSAPRPSPRGWMPWFEHPDLQCQKWRIVFGHWASLGFHTSARWISLDSGCVWGGCLTAVKLTRARNTPQHWQTDCPKQNAPRAKL